jgi:ABC-type transport system substrate-binding protein
LAEAGYPNGFKTSIHTFVRMVPRDFINAIANMLKEVGIETEADFPEAGRYTEYRFKGWKNSLMGHGMAPFDNMNTGFSFYFGGIQFPSVKKPDEWQKVYGAALGSEYVDPVKTQALVKLIHDDVMVIPYYEETVISFHQEGAHHFDYEKYRVINPVYEDVWLEPNLRK